MGPVLLRLAALCSLVVVVGCSDLTDPTSPGATDPGASDVALTKVSASITETPGFGFLPPIGNGEGDRGKLVSGLLPVLRVQVCIRAAASCEEVVAEFSARGGDGARLDLQGNHFHANWKVDRTLDDAADYRIRVLAGPMELGAVDVDIVKGGKGGSGRNGGDAGTELAVRSGSTLPIKFQIDQASIWDDLPSDLAWKAPTGVAGGVGELIGGATSAGGDLELYIGGQPTPIRRAGDGRLLAAIPLFLADGLRPTPPEGPVDLLLFAGGQPVAWTTNGPTIVSPPDAPGASRAALTHLDALSASTMALAQAPSSPGIEEAWSVAAAVGFSELVGGAGPGSLRTAIESADLETLRFLDAWFASSGVLAALERFSTELGQVTAGLSSMGVHSPMPMAMATSAPAEIGRVAALAASPQLAPGAQGSQLPANILAERMQLYEVASLFGEVVVAETATEFGLYVGLAAGAIGLVQGVPGVAITSAVLSVADFAVNKLAVGVLPSVIDEVSLEIAKTTLQPGEETIAEVRIQASNQPPPIGLQYIVSQALTIMGVPGGSQAQSLKEVLEAVALFYLQTMQSALSAYSDANPDLNLDLTVASVPSMTWWSNVLDETLIEPVSLSPSIVAALNDAIDWVAADDQLGSAAVFVRTVTGPESHRLDLPESIAYTGGAFGIGATASPSITLNVVGELVMRVDFAETIEQDGFNALEARAGYLSATGDTIWTAGIGIQFIAEGGVVQSSSGTTDVDGQFVTLAQLSPGSDEIMISVTASDAFGQQQTITVEATANVDPGQIDLYSIYAGYGAFVTARQQGVPTASEGDSETTSTMGGIAGTLALSKAAGTSSANASVTHSHSVTQPDAETLLLATVSGSISADAHAQLSVQGRARGSSGSDLHLILEVLDNPVYLVIEGQGITTGTAAGEVQVSKVFPYPQAKLYEHEQLDTLTQFGTSITLPPGHYSIDAALSVLSGAGLTSSDLLEDVAGAGSYDVTIKILSKPPSSP